MIVILNVCRHTKSAIELQSFYTYLLLPSLKFAVKDTD